MTSINAIGTQNPNGIVTGGTQLDAFTTAFGTLCAGTSGTGPIQTISPGTSTNVLTSAGSTTWPSFANLLNGATWIGSVTASNVATIAFSVLMSSTYDNYLVTLEDVFIATTANNLLIQVGTGAGPTYVTSGYLGTIFYPTQSSTVVSGANGTAQTQVCVAQTNTSPSGGILYIYNCNLVQSSTVGGMMANISVLSSASSIWTQSVSAASFTPAAAVTSARFSVSSGNITSGTFKLYGLKN